MPETRERAPRTSFNRRLTEYLQAGYPCLQVVTPEPDRAIQATRLDGWNVCVWDCLVGIRRQDGSLVSNDESPVEAVNWLVTQTEPTLLYVWNLHHFLQGVDLLQAIINAVPAWKASACALALVGPEFSLPQEVNRFFSTVDFSLPTPEELVSIQEELGVEHGVSPSLEAAQAGKGLTEFEAETAFAYSLVTRRAFDPSVITEQKKAMIRRTGLMEFWPPVDPSQVGGLSPLKSWLENRRKAFLPDSGLPRPKAILLVGIPGTGKSLTAKATAALYGWPLIRLDIGALKGSLVGESERKIRQATHVIDGFGQAVVWIDELEKAFGGVASSNRTDGGTTSGMFGHFLTWLQETSAPILVVATANDIGELPPEFLRAGRFDAVWFVDLPGAGERREILRIMAERYGTRPEADKELEELVRLTAGWTGSEIEQATRDTLFDGPEAWANVVPLGATMKEPIEALRRWAAGRARRANLPDQAAAPVHTVRRVRTAPEPTAA